MNKEEAFNQLDLIVETLNGKINKQDIFNSHGIISKRIVIDYVEEIDK